MKYKAVIFDLFGTLVETFPFREHEQVMSQMAAALALPCQEYVRRWEEVFPLQELGAFPNIETIVEHVCQSFEKNLDPDLLNMVVGLRLDFTRRCLQPRTDAVETLTRLKTAGFKIGLVSNSPPGVPGLWPETPLAELVEGAIFSCEVGFAKPTPRIYELACERLAVHPQHCLYVGDGGSQELNGAAQIGMHPVLIRVPYDDLYDAGWAGRQEWQGTTVSALTEILALIL
jgi:putative hydrolase of the HAD superfamily